MDTLRTSIISALVLTLAFVINPALAAQMNQREDTAQADARYVIKGAEVYDKNMDLTWQRCSVGQHWDEGAGCVGAIQAFTFNNAQSLEGGGWRVPTKAELRSLIIHEHADNRKSVIDEIAFPGLDEHQLLYWTNMPFDSHGWYIRFSDGHTSYNTYRGFTASVRLVRSGQ